jgi:hypothetical protein
MRYNSITDCQNAAIIHFDHQFIRQTRIQKDSLFLANYSANLMLNGK